MRNVFAQRAEFKPFEYPEVIGYKDAINHSFWLVSEWNFLGDIHDFNTRLSPLQKAVVRNTLLAISQIEVAVKKFWTRLGETFPKAEFEQIGVTFGESEVRHADAYSHLLQVLGLNGDFASLRNVPAIQNRMEYLGSFFKKAQGTPASYAMVLTLFSLFVENVSLFSQFAIIKSFNKHLCVLKDVDNVVQATQKEEQIHAMFGTWLINQIRSENPQWFDEQFYMGLDAAASRALVAEYDIIDWIFSEGDLDFISRISLKNFITQRLNRSIAAIGGQPTFHVNEKFLGSLQWFNDELQAEVNTDFFHKRPVTYSKKDKPITAGDLF